MKAYYNEIDPKAAAWLRELIKQGHIAPGDVDERSIEDVRPDELSGYTQCHFFAGIGVWSYALRQSGWSDDRPVWTGSCPCQPFSSAGKGKGFDDERHLWPVFHWLIKQCRPECVFGEQVAGKAGETWLDVVSTDLEGEGYAGSAVTAACGFGAPHQRKRLYWVAEDASSNAKEVGRGWRAAPREAVAIRESGEVQQEDGADVRPESSRRDEAGKLANSEHEQRQRGMRKSKGVPEEAKGREAAESTGLSASRELANAEREGSQRGLSGGQNPGRRNQHGYPGCCGSTSHEQPCPTNGHWRPADWLFCRDGKWRSVEPAIISMANGIAFTMGYMCCNIHWKEKIEEMGYAEETIRHAKEILCAMRAGNGPEALWLQTGRQKCFFEANVLFAFLLEYAGQLRRFLNCATSGSPEGCWGILRDLQKTKEPSCSSFGLELPEQFSREFADTLRELPQETAFKFVESMNGFPLANGATERVGRLRGYGNAIVAQQAQAFIESYIELQHNNAQ